MRRNSGQRGIGGGLRSALALGAGLALAAPAWGGSFSLGPVETTYKVTLGYGLSMRMEDPEPALIDGPVDPLESVPPNESEDGLPKFKHTGLPTTINFDDANRNFEKNALLNNRASAVGELQFTWGSYGAIFSGAGFYDRVFQKENDNDSADTINKESGAVNEFTEAARLTSGERSRLLEAYAYGDWWFGEEMSLNLRFGKHLTAWGESLFFPGIVSAQGPFDATKAFVPGAEIKEILLPVNQAAMQMGLSSKLSVLGFYQLEFKPTEIFPAGDFFSPADLVGPGGTIGYGSVNPLYGEGCPGLFGGAPIEQFCDTDGATGEPFDAPENIMVFRKNDILPSKKDKPWGAGLKYQITPVTNIGAYYLKYHNHNPSVKLNMGFATIGYDPITGDEITTQAINQRVPITYNVVYADNIEMRAASFTTVLWVFNVAGEYIERNNIDTSVAADISGVRSPVGTRGNARQAQVSLLYAANPKFAFYDEIALVVEMGWLKIEDIVPAPEEEGIEYVGNRDVPFYDRESSAVQVLVLPKGRNVIPGWDLGTPLSFAALQGNPSVAGTFGSLYGDGDMRFSAGVTMQYLQNLEFTTAYNGFLGDPDKHIGASMLKANPYVDHDYLSFTVKYNL